MPQRVHKDWWRSVDGIVTHDSGFCFEDNPDEFIFDTEPEHQHVDELFETEIEAVEAAVKFLHRRIDADIAKLRRLGHRRE